MTNGKDRSIPKETRISCGEIQELLFDYITRELGEGRSVLVREHLRKCPECQRAAACMQSTFELLHAGSRDWEGLPSRLSDERRARIVFAFAHPVLDWAYRRHVLVSIIITVIALTLLTGVLYHVKTRRSLTDDPGIPVIIGAPPSGEGAPPS